MDKTDRISLKRP